MWEHAKIIFEDDIMSARFTGTEMLLATTALEVVKSLLVLIGNKLDGSEGSDVEAMEQVLGSMQKAIEIEKKIQEAQNEINNEDIDIDNWTSDSK